MSQQIRTVQNILLVGVALGSFVWGPAFAQSAVPQLINYQGRLTDEAGGPLPTQEYTLEFSIYDGPVAGATRVWGPQVFDGAVGMEGHGEKIVVVNGEFNVILGPSDIDGSPISDGLADWTYLYLEIKIGQNDPVLPRQPLLSTPYAMQVPGSIPVQGITMFFGDLAFLPDNWQLCDGSMVDDPESPLSGTLLPNLRNRFTYGAHPAAQNLLETGGSTSHSHSFQLAGINHGNDSGTQAKNGIYYPPATQSALATDPTIKNLTMPSPIVDPFPSHGHMDGIATGSTNSGYSEPPYIKMYMVCRIK